MKGPKVLDTVKANQGRTAMARENFEETPFGVNLFCISTEHSIMKELPIERQICFLV